jgi:hypothetical protein
VSAGIGIALLLLILNLIGLARYPGGPLRDPGADGPFWLDTRPSDQGAASSGEQPADWAKAGAPLYYGLLTLHNPWPWSATVEAITPIDPTPGLTLVSVFIGRSGTPGGTIAFGPAPEPPSGQTLDGAYARLPAPVGPGGDSHELDAPTLLVIRADQPGSLGFSALAVDYRVGPLTFRTIQHFALTACVGPLSPGVLCLAD